MTRRRQGSKPRGEQRFQEADYGEVPVQLLAKWLERGTISQPLYRAGNRFHCEVQSMHEPNLHAMPLVKVRVDCSAWQRLLPQGSGSDASRAAVLEKLEAVGGPASGTASVLYHVVGLEWPIRRWCQAVGAENDPRFASGMLVSALEILAIIPAKLAADKKLLTRRGSKK